VATPFLRFAALAVGGIALGVGLSLWLGYDALNVIILVIGAGISYLVARLIAAPGAGRFVLAAAIQGGYALWLLAGATTVGRWGGLVDVLPLIGGVIWLLRWPGSSPVLFLLAVHAVEVVLLFAQGTRNPNLVAELPLLGWHVALRAAGCWLMVRALNAPERRALRRRPA
jgi:hypothetical protein